MVSVDCFFCSIPFRFFRGSFVSLGVCVCLQMNPKRKRPQKERGKGRVGERLFFATKARKKERVDRRCAQKSQSNKFTFLLFYVSEEFVFFLRAQRSTIVSHLFFSSFSFTRGAPRKNEENRKKNDTVPRPEIPQSPMEQRNPTRNKKKQKKNGFVLGVGVIVSLFVVDVHLFHRFFSLPCVCYFCRPSSTPIRCHTKSPLPLAVLVQFAFGPNWL